MESNSMKTYRHRLTSLTTHLRKYEKPTPHGYDTLATTYISSNIPWKRIVPDETDSYTAEILPFSQKFEIEKFTLQEKERKLRGESVRKKDLLPSSHQIIQDIKEARKCSKEEQLDYLYFKAMQHSELNKALALDEKFPKPDANVIRSTFSKEHQAAVAAMRNKLKIDDEREAKNKIVAAAAPFQQSRTQLIQLPSVPCTSGRSRAMATDAEREVLSKLRLIITEALGEPSPREMLTKTITKEPWQFKAKPDRPRVQPSKKRKLPWKRNVYPPKSREERIAEMRRAAPPLTQDYMQTDQLPGLWEPELMIETFKTAAGEAEEEDNREDCIDNEEDWWTVFHANRKCLEWLKSIPDFI